MKIGKKYLPHLQKLADMEAFFSTATEEAKGNTALIPSGQRFASQMEALTKLITNRKHRFISAVLAEMNIQSATVNITDGSLKNIKRFDDEKTGPTGSKKDQGI